MRTAIAALLVACAGAPLIAAESGPLEAGTQALREGRWSDAEGQFARALELSPHDGDLATLLGIARWHRGDSRGCAESLQRALAVGTRYEARALYYLALVQIELGQRDEARSTLSRLVKSHGDSPEAAKVRDSGALTDQPDAASPDAGIGEILLLLQAGWDEHPDEIGDTAGSASAGSDLFWLAHLTVGVRTSFAHLAASYTHLDYASENTLDADALRLSADRAFHRGGRDTLTPRYALRLLWLDREFFETRHDLSLRWNRLWSEDRELDITPSVAYRQHADAYAGADGWVSAIDARSTRHLPSEGFLRRLRLGVDLETVRATDAWLGWNEASIYGGAHAALPWRLAADGGLRLRWRGYGASDPAFGERRSDVRAEAELTLERPLRSWLIAELTTLYAINRSSVDAFDYARAVASLGLVALF